MKKTKTKVAKFKVRVVYGFLHKLKIVLLGDIMQGKLAEGMLVRLLLNDTTVVGSWPIIEVLNMDFINDEENENFVGLMLRCKDEDDYNLLKSLRVYDEVVSVEPLPKAE
ncbi:MAG: hypothetical protein MK212_16040 [Saprospiraceae bacterium]|nr:hypothetical protein [Saprospiraceae bacterium]